MLLDIQRVAAVAAFAHVFPQDRYPFPADAIRGAWHAALADPSVEVYVADLVDGVEEREAPVTQRGRRPRAGHELSAKSLLVGLRVVVLAVVASTAFMVTTWLSALR